MTTINVNSPAKKPFKKSKLQAVNAVSPWANAILHIIFIFFALCCILPLLIVVSVSFSSEQEIIKHGYSILPRGFTIGAYEFFTQSAQNLGRVYMNTIIATLAGSAITVFLVALYAYPLSRRDFRFRNFFTFFNFFTMLFGGGLVPFFIICRVLGLYNNLFALFIPLAFNQFWVIVMRTFYNTNVPDAVIESARIDGATETRTLFQIVMPLAIPGLATVALFSVINIWNNFFMCLLLTNGQSDVSNLQYMIYKVLTSIQYLRDMITSNAATAGSLGKSLAELPNQSFRMAMAVVTIGPIILAYPFFQKYFVKGLTIGAVKG